MVLFCCISYTYIHTKAVIYYSRKKHMPYIFSQRLTDDLTAVERTVTLIDVTEPWWQPSGMYTPRQRTSAEVAALPVYRNFVLERTTRHQNRRVVSERVGQIAMPQS